ncbi:MAG: hypothetical protein NVS2B12_20290 [Ktedonobacteraceae bacterium]
MLARERILLRLHVEAVWGVQLPPLVSDECELLLASSQPYWQCYVADIATARIHIWRPDVSVGEREALRLRVGEAVEALAATSTSLTGISREVALAFTGSPMLDLASASRIARPLAGQDRSLIELFQPDATEELLQPDREPLIGVIDSGRLLCVAHSSRRTEEACELGIDTLPDSRRRGYALAATVAWTQAVLQEGLVPIYSAFVENGPSLRLAAKAGYRAFARGATYEI